MGIRTAFARGMGLTCGWGMRRILHRGATTLPGRIALAIDPEIVSSLAQKPRQGSIVVCGTNGKTTTNNVLAKAIEAQGNEVLCNWAGANMESGVAAAMLPAPAADWGVFENDELSTARIVPRLKPRYLVLLNLFRDQLDRCGEIDRVQQTIAAALEGSPSTVLVYNADDPFCTAVAAKVRGRGGRTLSFGIGEDLGLPGDRVYGGGFCRTLRFPPCLFLSPIRAAGRLHLPFVRLRPRRAGLRRAGGGGHARRRDLYGRGERPWGARAARSPLGRCVHGLQPAGGLCGSPLGKGRGAGVPGRP